MSKNAFPKMSKSELLGLVKEVSTSLKNLGAADLAKLAKADGAPPPAEGSASSASGSPSASEGSASGSEGSASAGGPPPGADPSAAPPPGAEASAAPPPPGAEGSAPPPGDAGAPPPGAEAAPQGPSFEELVSLYAALPPPDLEAHAAAMQQAMAMKQGAGAGAPPPGADAGAGAPPPAGPPGAPPSAGPGMPPPMGKQEVATHDPNIGLKPGGGTPAKVETANPNIGPTKKSEDDRFEKLSKAVEDIGKVVETMLTVPQRKAVTGLTIIPMRKSEEKPAPSKKAFADLTKAELHTALKVVTAPTNTKLSKSERDAVTDYCLNPASVDLAVIEGIYNKS